VKRQRGWLILEGGLWRVRYRAPRDAAGTREHKSAALGAHATRREAREAADRAMLRLCPPQLAPGTSLPWSAWCAQYIDRYVCLLRPSSRGTIISVIKCDLQPAFAPLRLHELGQRQVQEWVSRLVKRGAAPATVRLHYAILRRMLRRAALDGLAACAPLARSIEFGKSVAVQASVAEKAFTPDEMKQIIEGSERPWRTIYSLAAYAGLRAGEILGLERRHVDLANRQLHIGQSAVLGKIQVCKTRRSEADLWISDALAKELREHLEQMPGSSALLFPGKHGRPLWSSGVRARHLAPLLKKLNIRERSLHAFRHGCAFAMFRAGAGATAVRDALRHSSLSVTEKYAGSAAPDRRAAFDMVASLISSDDG
jgi:integrase